MKLDRLTPQSAANFYRAHKGQSYYKQMCIFIASGPVVAMVLEKANAVAEFDQLKEVLRTRLAQSREANAIQGADTEEAVAKKIAFFFSEMMQKELSFAPEATGTIIRHSQASITV